MITDWGKGIIELNAIIKGKDVEKGYLGPVSGSNDKSKSSKGMKISILLVCWQDPGIH